MVRNASAELDSIAGSKKTRRSFLGRTAALTAGAGVAGLAALTPSPVQASDNPLLIARAFHDIRRHENAHRNFLLKALGKLARPKPTFMNLLQPSVLQFVKTSKILENTGVGAYTAAASNIFNPLYVAAAASIALIEGRHASYLDAVFDKRITTNVYGNEQSFEGGLSPDEVGKLAGNFIANLNGGPPLTYNGDPKTRTAKNDIDILNFALALEYLEAEFYNINVPIHFPLI